MSKGKIIAIAVVVVLISAVVGGLLWYQLSQKTDTANVPSYLDNTAVLPTSAPSDQVYKDESGYSFVYPTSVKISDVTPDGNMYYSMLNLSRDGKTAKITIVDTTYKTIEDWLAKDKTAPKNTSLVGASSLGGVSAKQYSYGGNLATMAIDKGVLYWIEGPKDNGFWEKFQNQIVSTFAFGDQAAANSGGAGDANTIYESEEVVE